ncbi:14469_t:CDS:2 [Ambispora leptoticha]|uniref:14469_t:CDS:1 n=1 Tax=Ambispora leptoticha TaxID=144679 RepID=A0A9N9BC06_9GLOM|nr:14469_t:CDS:2 [Ambispora leptoticha]
MEQVINWRQQELSYKISDRINVTLFYLLIGVCPVILHGLSAIAPFVVRLITHQLSQIKICGAYDPELAPCPGMKDRLHVDETYVDDFNKTYNNKTIAIKPRDKAGKKFSWAIEGMWQQPHQKYSLARSTYDNQIYNRLVIDLSSRSLRYSQSSVTRQMYMISNGNFIEHDITDEPKTIEIFHEFVDNNSAIQSNAEIECAGFGDIEYISDHIKPIHVLNMRTILAQWYIETANLDISDMEPWWGGVKSGENLPNNSILISNDSLWLPAGTSFSFSIYAGAQTADVPPITLQLISELIAHLINNQVS